MNIPVKVYALLSDPHTEAQVVLLRDEQSQMLLPIWIGSSEAVAIRLAMEKTTVSRPLTHDLLKDILNTLHFRLDKVVINDVNNNTYYAALYLEETEQGKSAAKGTSPDGTKEGERRSPLKSFQIDARPSDAITLSVRYGAPLYIAEEVIQKRDSEDSLTEWLSRLHPEDFGSFYNV
jgi:bifunctional DNase/RNase